MIRRDQTFFNPNKISRVDFSKHIHSISLRRISIGVLVGFVVVMLLAIAFV